MSKIEHEKKIVGQMIALYCRRKHGNKGATLCPECQELADYAMARLSRCPMGDNKSACVKCHIHCYKPAMRQRIAKVMRYSGPWMLIYHPLTTLTHIRLKRN